MGAINNRGGTGGVSSLQEAYDNSNPPRIVLTATRGPIVLQPGTGLTDEDALFVIQDLSSTITSFILGDGTAQFAELITTNATIINELALPNLIGLGDEILIIDSNGIVQNSGLALADVGYIKHYAPNNVVYTDNLNLAGATETDLGINTIDLQSNRVADRLGTASSSALFGLFNRIAAPAVLGVALGYNNVIEIGSGSGSNFASHIAVGVNNALTAAIGGNAPLVVFGSVNTINGATNVLLMGRANTVGSNGNNTILIGQGINATSGLPQAGVFIGTGSVSAQSYTIIGREASVTAADVVLLGRGCSVSAQGGAALGRSASVTHLNSVALGRGAVSTSANTVTLGNPLNTSNNPALGLFVTRTDPAIALGSASAVFAGGISVADDSIFGGDLSIDGKLTVAGLIDPTGLQFDPVTANPGTPTTIWVNSNDGNALYYGTDPVAAVTTTFISGIQNCNTTNIQYTINHIATGEAPTVSLIAPNGDAALYIVGIHSVTATSFVVVLSEVPSISGYQIAWYRGLGAVVPSPVREEIVHTTQSLNDDEVEEVEVAFSKSFHLLKIETSDAAWVRLYVDAQARSDDDLRDELDDPAASIPLIAEVLTTGSETVRIAPGFLGYNDDDPVTDQIYLSIKNKSGSTTAIACTFTIIKLEP